MAVPEPIRIQGLREFSRALRRLDSDLPKALKRAQDAGADVVVRWAQPRVPQGRSGRARRSIRATSTRAYAKVTGGGARVPYYPWLDFGGRVGRKRSVHRAFLAGGRYVYPGYHENVQEVHDELVQALLDVARAAGVVLDGG